jgi:hypothetical protein
VLNWLLIRLLVTLIVFGILLAETLIPLKRI